MATVFVYGTLTDARTARTVLPSWEFCGPATIRGLHRVDGEYPTLAPGGETAGRLLATDHLDALDEYEGVDRGLYERISLPLVAGAGDGADAERDDTVETYVGDPVPLGASVDWPGDDPFPACVRAYVRDRDVRVVRARDT